MISMVVVVAACLVWVALFPRTKKVQQPVADAAGIAREVGSSQRWDVAIADGLPRGWSPINVRLLSDVRPATWQAGYDAPEDRYVAVRQTPGGGAAWVRAQTGSAKRTGTVTIGGTSWTAYVRDDGDQRALVRSTPLGRLATVVIGTGPQSQLERFAAALRPLSANGTPPSAG